MFVSCTCNSIGSVAATKFKGPLSEIFFFHQITFTIQHF